MEACDAKPCPQAAAIGVDVATLATIISKFNFTVEKINKIIPAELNQELFDKVYGPGVVTDEKAFRAKVEEELGKGLSADADRKLKADIQDGMIEKLSSNGLTIHGVVDFVDKGFKEIIMIQGKSPAKSYYTGRSITMDGKKLKIADAGGRGYMSPEGRPGFSVEMVDQQNQKYYLYNLEKGRGTQFSDEMEAPEEIKDLFR